MRPLGRAWLCLLLLGAWFSVGAPLAAHTLEANKQGRASLPSPGDLSKRLALLPADALDAPAVVALKIAIAADPEYAKAEFTWNREVAAALSTEERATALTLADLDSPSPSPPAEARQANGDMVAVASTLLHRYGYLDLPDVDAPTDDAWPGPDRRTRARGIVALAEGPGLNPTAAQTILHATLRLLQSELDRAHNTETMQLLLPVAMGKTR